MHIQMVDISTKDESGKFDFNIEITRCTIGPPSHLVPHPVTKEWVLRLLTLETPSSFGSNDRFYVSSLADTNYQAFVLHVMHDWIETLAFRIRALKIYSEVDQLTSVPHKWKVHFI